MGIAKGAKGKRTGRREAGAAMVEAAISLTAFLLLVFGVIETGRFLETQQVLTNAAREGARLAVAPYAGTSTLPLGEVNARVNTFLTSANITGATITITPVSIATGAVTTEFTKVTVSVPYSLITGLGWFGTFNVTLSGQSMMRNETSP